MRNKNIFIIFFLLLVVIAGIFYFYFIASNKNENKKEEKIVVREEKETINRYYVPVVKISSDKENISKAELVALAEKDGLKILEKDKKELEKFLGTKISSIESIELKENEIGILRIQDLTPKYKTLNFEGKSIFEDDDYALFEETIKEKKEELFDRKNVIKMTSVGDVIPGRTVYVKMRQLGYDAPFKNVKEKLKSSDITFGSLEAPISDLVTPPTEGMSFVAPKQAMKGLVDSGFDIVGIANNHSTNFGTEVFSDFLNNLKEAKIKYVGGGLNQKEAKEYKTIEIKGKTIAFLDVNSIVGDIVAGEESPGDWHVDLPPWGEYNQSQIDELTTIIKKAKKESDFVIPMIHWSAEYTHDPSEVMKKLGHEMVDAGAETVVGTHPHWTQGVEVYKGKIIAYSLGNFVFDQEWSRETKEGLILDSYFYGDRMISVVLTPVLIEDFHRPRILEGEEGAEVMRAVWESSRKINPEF